jgi:hypothetical protein
MAKRYRLQTKKPYNRKPKLNKWEKREQNPAHPYTMKLLAKPQQPQKKE